jgi:hypothetical protein
LQLRPVTLILKAPNGYALGDEEAVEPYDAVVP